jgi:hypothetical protein
MAVLFRRVAVFLVNPKEQEEATSLGMGRGSFSDPFVTFTRQVRHLPPEPFRDV